MRGKLIEDVLYEQAIAPAQRVTAATLYNGSAVSVSNNGIDTRECDEIVFTINAGEFQGAAAMDAAIVQNTVNNPATATPVTGNASPNDTPATAAAFTQITSANDNQQQNGSIKSKNFNRYMWIRTYNTAVTNTFGAIVTKGKCDRDPQTNSPVFDLNY